MTTEQVARELGISRFAVIRRIRAGKIPADRYGRKGRYIIDRELLRMSQQPKRVRVV